MSLPDASRLLSVPSETWRALGDRLHDVGLTGDYIAALTRPAERVQAPIRRPIQKWHLRRLREPGGYAMRLFMFKDPVTEDEAREVLGEVSLTALVDAGLLSRDGNRIACPFFMNFANGLFVFCDDLTAGDEAVMGIGETTADLCRATYSAKPLRRALDLGCGAGAAALMYAEYAEKVFGTDINPRAIVISKMNAMINGIENAEFRVGDMFAPVADESFDLIVSQPPFVPQPEGAVDATYLYGGARGDELALRLLRELPPYLSKTGRAVVLVEWPVVDDEPLEKRVRAVLPDDVNVLLVQAPGTPIDVVCSGYAAAEHPTLGREFEEKVFLRRDHAERMGIKRMRMTYNIVERAEGASGWTSSVASRSFSEVTLTSRRVDKLVAARALAGGGADAMLGAALRLADGVTFAEEGERLVAKFPDASLVPPLAMARGTFDAVSLIHRSDTVRAAIDEFARVAATSAGDATKKLMPAVQHALLYGLLEAP